MFFGDNFNLYNIHFYEMHSQRISFLIVFKAILDPVWLTSLENRKREIDYFNIRGEVQSDYNRRELWMKTLLFAKKLNTFSH